MTTAETVASSPVARLLRYEPDHGVTTMLWLWCPACSELHQIVTERDTPGPVWAFDGDLERPSIEPSVLVRGGRQGSDHVCHSFVRLGVWEFLSDCTHALAGQRVEVAPFPDWLRW